MKLHTSFDYCWILYVYIHTGLWLLEFCFSEQKVHIHSPRSIFHLLFIVTCVSCTRDRVVNASVRIFCRQTIRNVPVFLLWTQFQAIVSIGNLNFVSFEISIRCRDLSSPNRICQRFELFFIAFSYRIIKLINRRKKKT